MARMRCSTCVCRCPILRTAKARARGCSRTSPSVSRKPTLARAPSLRLSARRGAPATSGPHSTMMKHVAACLTCGLLALPVLAAAGSAARTYPLTPTRGGRLLVEARVNGVPVEALLDSAAEMSFIDPALAQRLGLTRGAAVAAQGSGAAPVDAGLVPGVRLEAFGLLLPDQTLAVTGLADIGTRLLHRRIDMILGREVFDAARLEIDIAHRRLRVLKVHEQPRGTRLVLSTQRG